MFFPVFIVYVKGILLKLSNSLFYWFLVFEGKQNDKENSATELKKITFVECVSRRQRYQENTNIFLCIESFWTDHVLGKSIRWIDKHCEDEPEVEFGVGASLRFNKIIAWLELLKYILFWNSSLIFSIF